MSRRHISLITKAKALALIAKGVSSREIAKALGVKSKSTIGRWRALVEDPPHVKPGRQPVERDAQLDDSLEPVPCAHLRTVWRTCLDCKETLPARPPTWAQEQTLDYSRDLTIASPSWHTF